MSRTTRCATAYQFYLVFEEANGGELLDRLLDRGRFSEHDACRTIHVLVEAVAHMHRHNIVHRDIKPENILYRTRSEDANIVIVDFGIAAHMRADESDLHGMYGSVGYAAPEVVMRYGHGKPVDMWGIGIVTYAMCVAANEALWLRSVLVRRPGTVPQAARARHGRVQRQVLGVCQQRGARLYRALPHARPREAHHGRRGAAAQGTCYAHQWFSEWLQREPESADVSAGLRDNYRSRWKTAITAVRATNILSSTLSQDD